MDLSIPGNIVRKQEIVIRAWSDVLPPTQRKLMTLIPVADMGRIIRSYRFIQMNYPALFKPNRNSFSYALFDLNAMFYILEIFPLSLYFTFGVHHSPYRSVRW